jgi:hypothetical protein
VFLLVELVETSETRTPNNVRLRASDGIADDTV